MSSTTLSMSHEAMDRVLEEHFRQEAEGDVAGTLATYTEDVVHDVVGDPMGTLHDRQSIGKRYAQLFSNVRGESSAVKHRLYGDDFVVDDKIWTARVDGEFLGVPGHGRRIHVRVLHVFEFRDGLISRENVWLDGASALAQLRGDDPLAAGAGETRA
ncbi:MAG TPA: nuclear transport factor 2 family protein [Chloroflexota bacterium]